MSRNDPFSHSDMYQIHYNIYYEDFDTIEVDGRSVFEVEFQNCYATNDDWSTIPIQEYTITDAAMTLSLDDYQNLSNDCLVTY